MNVNINEPKLKEVALKEVALKEVALNDVLENIIESLSRIDFKDKVFEEHKSLKLEHKKLKAQLSSTKNKESLQKKMKLLRERAKEFKLAQKHHIIVVVEEVLKAAERQNLGLCLLHASIHMYNGRYWESLERATLKLFLRRAAKKLGVDKFDAKYHRFSDELLKQFLTEAFIPKPDPKEGVVLINLSNGTYHIKKGKTELKDFDSTDYLMYQLPFEYNKNAQAPLFQQYLDKVLPDKDCQAILSEFLGYLFLPHLKLEKALILYGSGANGKSVFFEIVRKLIGRENVSNFSLSSLTNENGYYRAQFANKLLNYASEISGKLEASKFKQLVSGEPIEARSPYGNPFVMEKYGRFIFNCNELPKEVEHTNAFFRRFLILPFNIQIPPDQQDKQLPKKIIDKELSGIFNWALEGLNRLQNNQQFTNSEIVERQLKIYQESADNVKQFLKDESLIKSARKYIKLKDLYLQYQEYCRDSGYKPLSKKNLRARVEKLQVVIERKSIGNVVYLKQEQQPNISIANTA
jgi:putative DNA primase/helicase